MKKFIILMIALFILYWLGTMTVPSIIKKGSNPVKESAPYNVSPQALELYQSLDFVADLHCDALLWGRNLTERAYYGHVDFPRMQEANVAMQVFTIVSKSPRGQNMDFNKADTQDNITLLNIVQGRPISNWFSMKRVKNLVGVQHVALGSDYDGSLAVPFDITGLPIIVEALLHEGFSEDEIRAAMGENVKRFLLENLG